MADQEAALASVRAYNRWHLEQWCATAPERYIPCPLPWLGVPQLPVEEVRRNADLGFTSVSFSENPEVSGFGSPYSGA
ncbi:MAG: hypothetical protein ACYDB3_12305 [Acidimicrobiales bacterium]